MNHYTLLGVHKYSKPDEIKAAFSKLAMLYHPDRTQNEPNASAMMADLNVAYTTLKNPKSRKAYDTQLALTGVKCPACQGTAAVSKRQGYTKKIETPCATCKGVGIL